VNLIPNSLEDVSDPLSWETSCASGAFDSYATELGANLVNAGLQNSVIRLGPEMNGTWEADFMGTTTQEQTLWVECFANEVTALRQATGAHFLIDWDPNAGKGGYPYANFYPGNSYVDIMGLDLYDVDSNTPNTSVTFSQLANEPYGLNVFEAFAAAHGKPMSFPEWGLSSVPSGDDPGYIDGIGSSIANGDFAFETYFDGGSAGSEALALGSTTPLSLDAYQQWFGAAPPSAATISGTVTAVGGGDLEGICAEALLNGTDIAASASTAADGTYTISGLAPGSYGVSFAPGCGSGDFATQWYSGTASGTQSAPGALVAITAGSPATDINATMSMGASIAGTVSAAAGGADLQGICVNAFPVGATGSAGTTAASATDGTYLVEGLVPGSYYLEFSAGACGGSYVTQWYNGAQAGAWSTSGALAVTVAAASPATGINAAMVASTSISGTVTAATSGADIGNMCAWAYPVSGGAVEKATTALDGMYTISGIAPGSYNVEFYTYPCGGRNYVTQWYNGTPTGSSSASGASVVSASVASPAAEVNAALTLAASITGSVTAAVGGSPVSGICVSATSTGGGIGASTSTASGGAYTVFGLAAGTYDVVADPTCGGTVTTSYASPQPSSDAVTVIAGETLTYNVDLVQPDSIVDVITPSTIPPTDAAVGAATYSPTATASSGDIVEISLDGASSGCALNAGAVSFTGAGTCIIDFKDPSSGASDAYMSATQVQQSFSVAASSGGGGGGGGSGGGGAVSTSPSPPLTTTPTPPPTPLPTPSISMPTPREITYKANSTTLSASARKALRSLATKLTRGASITIIGYTHKDEALARRRADSVARFLEQQVSVHVLIKIVTTSTVERVTVVTTRL
jgi:outer membrane protein OmpA-like peptidoglycan-associated protein